MLNVVEWDTTRGSTGALKSVEGKEEAQRIFARKPVSRGSASTFGPSLSTVAYCLTVTVHHHRVAVAATDVKLQHMTENVRAPVRHNVPWACGRSSGSRTAKQGRSHSLITVLFAQAPV